MQVPWMGWVALAVSVVVAVLVDFAVVRVGLEFLRPTTLYGFWLGRAGKLLAVAGWTLYFTRYWFAQYSPEGEAPTMLVYALWAAVAVMAFLGAVTLPRRPRER